MINRDDDYAEVHERPKWTEDKDNPSNFDGSAMKSGCTAGNDIVTEVRIIRWFLQDTIVLSANGGVMYVNEMRCYLCRRIERRMITDNRCQGVSMYLNV